VVADETLVLQVDTDAESYVTGLDSNTGETRWKLDRPSSAVYASPVLYRSSDQPNPQVILNSNQSLLSIDPSTGNKNWEVAQGCASIPSTTVAGDLLLTPLNEFTALRPNGSTDSPDSVWSESRLNPDTPTPVAYDGRVYVVKGPILSCADLKTGKADWQLRLNSANSYASPLAGNGHLFLVDENGLLQTIRLDGKKGEVASQIDLAEKILGTPALADGALYVRSDKHLWKFADAD
jgi:outer membrane protein assembly factor BamB